MNRRLTIALLVAAVAVAGCSSVPATDTAATVGDRTLSNDQLATIMALSGLPATSASDARSTTATWIALAASRDALDAEGIVATDADRATAESQLADAPGFDLVTGAERDLVIDLQVTSVLLNQLGEGVDVPTFVDEAIDAAEIEIDPRIGTFDRDDGVIPLG